MEPPVRGPCFGDGLPKAFASCGNKNDAASKKPLISGHHSKKTTHTSRVPVPRPFGRNLSRLRVQRCLTQYELAVYAEISRYHLQRLEKGQCQPTLPVVLRLKKALKCSWDELMEGVEE